VRFSPGKFAGICGKILAHAVSREDCLGKPLVWAGRELAQALSGTAGE
jgi:hypothetical protein